MDLLKYCFNVIHFEIRTFLLRIPTVFNKRNSDRVSLENDAFPRRVHPGHKLESESRHVMGRCFIDVPHRKIEGVCCVRDDTFEGGHWTRFGRIVTTRKKRRGSETPPDTS